MSLTAVRSYFRTRFDSLGYKEWEDAFNFENIPENIIDQAYHIYTDGVTEPKMDQQGLEVKQQVITRLFLKGYRTPKDALDNAQQRLQDLIVEVLKPSNRLTGTSGLRNVLLKGVTSNGLSDSNDNIVLITATWTVQVNICLTA